MMSVVEAGTESGGLLGPEKIYVFSSKYNGKLLEAFK